MAFVETILPYLYKEECCNYTSMQAAATSHLSKSYSLLAHLDQVLVSTALGEPPNVKVSAAKLLTCRLL